MKSINSLVLQLPPIIGIWTAVVRILTPLLFIMAASGWVLGVHPIIAVVGLVFGGFAIVMMVGLITEMVVEVFLETRGRISRIWDRNTPPYSSSEISDLPVLYQSEENSKEQFYRWLRVTMVVYLMMVFLSVSFALLKPVWVVELVESPIIDLVIAIISLILQIPLSVMDLTAFAQYIPDPNTKWDGIVRVLLLGVPLPFMTITMANIRFKISRQRERVYRRLIEGIRQRREEKEGSRVSLTRNQQNSIILDLVLSLLIISLVIVTYK